MLRVMYTSPSCIHIEFGTYRKLTRGPECVVNYCKYFPVDENLASYFALNLARPVSWTT